MQHVPTYQSMIQYEHFTRFCRNREECKEHTYVDFKLHITNFTIQYDALNYNLLLFSDSSAVSASKRCNNTLISSLSKFQYLLTTQRTASSWVCRFSSCSILALSSASHLCLCSILCKK